MAEPNIRYTAYSNPHRLQWGEIVVQTGDWMALRDGRVVYTRVPWEGAPFAWYENPEVIVEAPVQSDATADVQVPIASAPPVQAAVNAVQNLVSSAERTATQAIQAVTGSQVSPVLKYWAVAAVAGILGYAYGRRG